MQRHLAAGSAGTVDVTVTTPGGTSSTSSSDQFTYDATPVVTGIAPVAGPIAGNTSVTITGTGFVVGSSTVAFGSTAGTSVSCSSTTSCSAKSPAGSAGTVDVTVTTPGGTSSTSSSDQFTYDATPVVTGIAPVAGPIAGNTSVTITGTGFVVGSSTVAFGGNAGDLGELFLDDLVQRHLPGRNGRDSRCDRHHPGRDVFDELF